MDKYTRSGRQSGAYQFCGTATWGSQSWLQPPLDAARQSTPKSNVFLKNTECSPNNEAAGRATAAKGGWPTLQSPKLISTRLSRLDRLYPRLCLEAVAAE